MVEEVVYLGFHQEVRVRLATGTLVKADVSNDDEQVEHEQGDPGRPCTCRPATCASSPPTTRSRPRPAARRLSRFPPDEPAADHAARRAARRVRQPPG